MNKLTQVALATICMVHFANAGGWNSAAKAGTYYEKTVKVVKTIYNGSEKTKRARTGATKFRNDAMAITKQNKQGQYKDAYTGKYHDAKDMHADHIMPHSKGGSNSSWNSAMTHKNVNMSKSDKINPGQMIKGYGNNKVVQQTAGKVAVGGGAAGAAATY